MSPLVARLMDLGLAISHEGANMVRVQFPYLPQISGVGQTEGEAALAFARRLEERSGAVRDAVWITTGGGRSS